MVNELCLTSDVVACEEHWLAPSKTERFSIFHRDFDFYAVPDMNAALSTGF